MDVSRMITTPFGNLFLAPLKQTPSNTISVETPSSLINFSGTNYVKAICI